MARGNNAGARGDVFRGDSESNDLTHTINVVIIGHLPSASRRILSAGGRVTAEPCRWPTSPPSLGRAPSAGRQAPRRAATICLLTREECQG